MSDPTRERKILVGIYLSEKDAQPRFRQICDDFASARRDISSWLAQGYVDIGVGDGRQDHYAPAQIYKVRLMPIVKVTTKPNTETELMGTNAESHWLDESGHGIDPRTVTM